MDAATAITALQAQKERGLTISSNSRPDANARQGWYNTTRAILAAAFGPDSPNIGAVMSAGPPENFLLLMLLSSDAIQDSGEDCTAAEWLARRHKFGFHY